MWWVPIQVYNPEVKAGTANAFATAAYKYGHSLIRPQSDWLAPDFLPLPIGPLNLRDTFFNPSQFRKSLGTDPILCGLLNINLRRVDKFLNCVLTPQLFKTATFPGMNLASLNIQHELPPHTIWKNFCLYSYLILRMMFAFFRTMGLLILWISGSEALCFAGWCIQFPFTQLPNMLLFMCTNGTLSDHYKKVHNCYICNFYSLLVCLAAVQCWKFLVYLH